MDPRRFKADFEDALKVVLAFNDVFVAGPAKWRESNLPFGKGRIKNALIYLNAAINTVETRRAIRQLFPRVEADLYLSEQFSSGALNLLMSLPKFLPQAEADLRTRVDESLGHYVGEDGLSAEVSPEDFRLRREHVLRDPIVAQEHSRWSDLETRISAEAEAYLDEAKRFTAF